MKFKGSHLKALFPWVIAALLLSYLFSKYPIPRLIRTSEYINLPLFVLFSVAYFLLVWWLDCWSLARFFSRAGVPTTARELSPPRLASYLMLIVNYGAGQGVFAYFFKRVKKVPFFRSSSLILLSLVIDVYWVLSLAALGTLFLEGGESRLALSRVLQGGWIFSTIGLLLTIVFFRNKTGYRPIRWLRSLPLFSAFREARPSDYLHLALVRLPTHLVVNTSLYFFAWSFGTHVPFWTVLAFQPIVILVGTIPLTPAGFGTIQLASVELFRTFVTGEILLKGIVTPEEILVSISLAFMLVNCLMKVIGGAYYTRRIFD